MDKRRLHHIWTKLRPLSPWYLLIIAIVSGVVCVNALRNNNLHMIQLRNDVAVTDEKNGDTETALRNLREYVYGHMNTDLSSGPNAIKPPIQLKYRYDRLVKAENDRVAAASATIYNDAQHACEAAIPDGFSGGVRIGCITDYVSSHKVATQIIPDSLYKFDFVSPSWSPDLAGWSLLATIVSLGLFIFLFVLDRWLKATLNV